MYRCLVCGRDFRTKYKPEHCKTNGCRGYIIYIDKYTGRVAQLLYNAGFFICYTELYESVILMNNATGQGEDVILVTGSIRFGCEYNPIIFENLYFWKYDYDKSENISELFYFDFYDLDESQTLKATAKKLRSIVKPLERWAAHYADNSIERAIHIFLGWL